MDRNQRDGLIFVLIAVSGYSFLPVFTNKLFDTGLEPLDIAFWRFLIAAPLFWMVALRRERPSPLRGANPLPWRKLLALGTLMGVAATSAFMGLQRIPASTFVVLFYTYPTMVALLSLFLGERLRLQAWIALGLTLVGIALTAPDFSAGLSGDNLPGVLLAFLNAFVVAVYYILNARILRGHKAFVHATALILTGALLLMSAVTVVRGGAAVPANLTAWLLLLGLALVSTVMPVFSISHGLQRLGATRASILGTVEPVLTSLLAVIFLGDRIRPIQLLGGAFILASILILQARRSPTRRSLQPDTTTAGD
jgi:drug/metabolite transporter (DMT)-like permease